MQQQTDYHLKIIFCRLLAAVENIAYPGVCSSAERCILALLFDLYSSCAHLRVGLSNLFNLSFSSFPLIVLISSVKVWIRMVEVSLQYTFVHS